VQAEVLALTQRLADEEAASSAAIQCLTDEANTFDDERRVTAVQIEGLRQELSAQRAQLEAQLAESNSRAKSREELDAQRSFVENAQAAVQV
jgi:hypothetical protein